MLTHTPRPVPTQSGRLGLLLVPALLLVTAIAVAATQGAAPQGGPPGGLPDLITPLRNTKGCLGVEATRTSSGKNVIFAWFEDKEAAKRWYYGEVHTQIIADVMPDFEPDGEAMHDVPDDVGPILAIAAITFAEDPKIDGIALPISQISIELYTPIKGGLSFGGRFSPAGMVVPRRKVIVDGQ